MRPQTRLLSMQPQIRLAYRICTHLLSVLLVLAIVVCDTAICNRMHDVYALLAHFPRQRLRKLAHRCATGAICGELRAASQRAKCAGKDEGLVHVSVNGVVGKRSHVRLSSPRPRPIPSRHGPQTCA
jgi:hypothetical protein